MPWVPSALADAASALSLVTIDGGPGRVRFSDKTKFGQQNGRIAVRDGGPFVRDRCRERTLFL